MRVYQRKDMINIGCDPKLYPTADYIGKLPVASEHESGNRVADWSDRTLQPNTLICTTYVCLTMDALARR